MCVNMTNVTQIHTVDGIDSHVNGSDLRVPYTECIYKEYVLKEREQLESYKMVGYVLGSLIILSNIIVVISSGLILKKGQQSKSTYLILGNVSLADTIVGFSLIFGLAIDNPTSANTLCIFQMGLLVCPAMVSIFSVGLIAVDRYLYILHGMYYQRWFSSTRVRIGILCIWLIGIVLGFLPITGWTNHDSSLSRCLYVGLFPGELILLNSFLSIIPIALVGVLYSIILIKALKTVNNLNAANNKNNEDNTRTKPKLRMFRGTVNYKKQNSLQSMKPPNRNSLSSINRSASFSLGCIRSVSDLEVQSNIKPICINDLINKRNNISENLHHNKTYDDIRNKNDKQCKSSAFIIDNTTKEKWSDNVRKGPDSKLDNPNRSVITKPRKTKDPNKWRAVTVVMLTSGSVIFTWMPFFYAVIFFVFCEDKLTNPKCLYIRSLLGGPLATLAFLNSILNPLIYAWWHKGFQRSVRSYYKKYFRKCFIISR